MTESSTAAFMANLGYAARDPGLFVQALTHGSHGDGGRKGGTDYQRLEFLGDRVLGLVCAEALYTRHTGAHEGELSHRLNRLVSRATCAEVARSINLAPQVRLGKQARDDGARDSDNVLGDVIEAIIGAIFIDSGLDAARQFILHQWGDRFNDTPADVRHPKSVLLEWAAQHRHKPPAYAVVQREGPDHAPRFTVSVTINKVGEASADGASKQEAEKNAASALMTKLGIGS